MRCVCFIGTPHFALYNILENKSISFLKKVLEWSGDRETIASFRSAQIFTQLIGSRQKSVDPFCRVCIITQCHEISNFQIPRRHISIGSLCTFGKVPELGNCQRFSFRISQLTGQQQETLFRAGQRKRFLMTGAFTSSSVKVPSSPRSMGLMV